MLIKFIIIDVIYYTATYYHLKRVTILLFIISTHTHTQLHTHRTLALSSFARQPRPPLLSRYTDRHTFTGRSV